MCNNSFFLVNKMSDIDRFELFTLVAQTCHLSQTATNLQFSKASLSKQIKKLERDLGVDLFLRSGRRLQLTAQGELLLQQCVRLKKELDDTRSICQSFHETPKGVLHIVALDYFAKRFIYPKLNLFLKKYPDLELIIDIDERIPQFEEESIDLAVGFSLIAPDHIIQRKMATTRFVMCAAPSYLKEHGTPISLSDLTYHRYIGHQARNEVCNTHL